MALVLKRTVNPTVELVTVDRAASHLRVDIDDDDALIGNLIRAAREYIGDVTGRAFVNETWRLSLDEWPAEDHIILPRAPLSSVTSVVYTNSAGVATTWGAANYDVDTEREPGRIRLAYGVSWPTATLKPTNPIQITYVAGYGATAASVPEQFKQAVLMLVAHWYENREAVNVGQGFTTTEVPLAVESLIWLNRVF